MKNTKMSSIFMVCQMLDKNARFPDEISYGSIGGPTFSTNVTPLANGGEQRKINWSYPRCRYNVIYGVKSYSQYEVLMDFFMRTGVRLFHSDLKTGATIKHLCNT